MNKPIRKGVSYLINENKIVVIRYLPPKSIDYYDIPGGKIEDNELPVETSIREFKEETGIQIVDQQYKGNVILEYPNRIFDFEIYKVNKYVGNLSDFEENDSMWIDIDELLKIDKKFASVEILRYINQDNIKLKIYSDEKQNIIKVEM